MHHMHTYFFSVSYFFRSYYIHLVCVLYCNLLMLKISWSQVHTREMDNHLLHTCATAKVPIKLKAFVALTMDVASASPRRYFFEARTLYVLTLLVFFHLFNWKVCWNVATASLYYMSCLVSFFILLGMHIDRTAHLYMSF